MIITETIEFWIIIYALEGTILGLVIIGNYLNLSIRKLLPSVLFGAVFGILIVGGIIVFQNNSQLMIFWAGAMVSLLIFAANLFTKRKSDKIDEILGRVKGIEERLDELKKK